MRTVRAMVEHLPGIRAADELARFPARRAASGNVRPESVTRVLKALRDEARLGIQREAERAEGMGALAIIRAANDRARAAGQLWEQRQARGEVV